MNHSSINTNEVLMNLTISLKERFWMEQSEEQGEWKPRELGVEEDFFKIKSEGFKTRYRTVGLKISSSIIGL